AGCSASRSGEGMPFMAARQPIEALSRALEQRVASGLTYCQGPGGQARIKVGLWGPREVLCHLVWWHQATVEGMESVLSGGNPYRFYASVDEMNARAVGRLAGRDIAALAEIARQLQARLVKAARALPDPNATVLVTGAGSGRSGLTRLEPIARHWSEHVRALQTPSAAA